MEQSTLERSRIPAPAATSASARGGRVWRLIRTNPLVPWSVLLLGLSLALVLWARTRPGFDPYGWLVWGHQTVIGSLDTNAAPSWKPLPFLFSVPYALFGHYQLWLWMITSVAVSLSGVVFAGRIAYRLTGAGPKRRYAAIAAAVFAGVALLGIRDYLHYTLSAQSDPMIVSLCLAAIDCHLSGRRRWAFALGALASLGRPEVWPFLAAYSIWAWLRAPEMRWLIVGGAVVLLALWFGIPALTSRSPFVAGTNALGSGRALHNNRVFGTIDRFLDLHETPLEVVALLSAAFALWRRDRVTVALALGAVVWVIVEIAFALHGWPGLSRYMFEAGAAMVVVAAVGIGRLLAVPPRLARGGRLATWGAAALAVVIVASLVPAALSRGRTERSDLKVQRLRTDELNRLHGTISRLGGAAQLRRCGEPLTRLEYQTVLAWELGVNVSRVGFKYSEAIAHGNPIVLFTPVHDGWKVQARHQRLPSCKRLPR
jgi:hypothetical protein